MQRGSPFGEEFAKGHGDAAARAISLAKCHIRIGKAQKQHYRDWLEAELRRRMRHEFLAPDRIDRKARMWTLVWALRARVAEERKRIDMAMGHWFQAEFGDEWRD